MLLCRKTFETTENYIGLQNEQNDELRHKTFKTTQNNESDQITMNLHRFDVTSIWRPNDQKCWVTSQTIQNR